MKVKYKAFGISDLFGSAVLWWVLGFGFWFYSLLQVYHREKENQVIKYRLVNDKVQIQKDRGCLGSS